jgi:hypothetical protein
MFWLITSFQMATGVPSTSAVAGTGQTILTFVLSSNGSSIVLGCLGLARVVPVYGLRQRVCIMTCGILTLTLFLGCEAANRTVINVAVRAVSGRLVHSLK